MSKLIDMYNNLKTKDKTTLYLFKSGIFYIFLSNDAEIMSRLLSLKLTPFSNNINKCGFPVNSLIKYISKINTTDYTVKIIDVNSNTCYQLTDYQQNNVSLDLIKKISTIDDSHLSISEAYSFISKIKLEAQNILKGVK